MLSLSNIHSPKSQEQPLLRVMELRAGRDARCFRRSGGLGTWQAWPSVPVSFLPNRSQSCSRRTYSSSDLRSGGQLAAMRTSLALPERMVFMVVLVPMVTDGVSVAPSNMLADLTLARLHDEGETGGDTAGCQRLRIRTGIGQRTNHRLSWSWPF